MQAGVMVLISDKADFRPRLFRRGSDSHYILIKGTMHQEEITIGTPNYIKQIDPNTITVGVFNTPLSSIDRSFTHKKKITKKSQN
jgi:hypothetical protein